MYIDSQIELATAQAVTATAVGANVVDLRALNLGAGSQAAVQDGDPGQGADLYLVVRTAVACTDVGSDATLQVSLETSPNSDLSASTVIVQSGVIPFASFSAAGSQVWVVPLPPSRNWRRYLGVRFTIGAGPLTAGAFDAFITNSQQNAARQGIYRSGFTVQ